LAEGFKLLDAYVEVTADATGIGEKVSKQFAGEVAPAAKKMADAVTAATQRVAAASKRQADAAASLRLAQMRLADVEKRAAPDSTALATAQEAVAKAQRNVAASAEGADRAQRSLGTAQTRLKESGSSAGSSYLSGLKGSLTSGVVGGLIGGVTTSVTSGLVHLVGAAVSDIGSLLNTVGGMVATTVIDFNSELESANIGFTTMLGSGAKAKSFLSDLQTFAKATPFDFGGLVHSAQNMLGMGISAKNIIPDLTALGDAVASVGGSATQVDQVTAAFSQMSAKGTVDLGNMYQVINGGVSHAFDYMAAGLHVTTGKLISMISAGDVASSKALPALVRGIEKGTKSIHGLGGMMDKQSSTFTGALSNIQDGLTQTTAKAFKPFFDVASRGMQRFATALSGKPVEKFTKDVTKTLKPFATEIGKWFKTVDFGKMFDAAGKGLKGMLKDIKPKDLVEMFKGIGKGATDLGKSIVALVPQVIKVLKDFGPALLGIIKWVVDVTAAFARGADQWHDAFDMDAKGLAVMVKAFQRGWDQIAGFLADTVKNFERGGQQLNDFFNGVGGFFGDLVGRFQHGWDQIAGFVEGGVRAFQRGGKQITDFFGALPAAFTTIGGQIVDGLTGGLRDTWSNLTGTLHNLAMQLPEPVRHALGIHSPSRVFHLIGTQVGQGLHQGLLGSVDQIKTASAKLADAVQGDKRWKGTALGKRMVAAIKAEAKELEGLSTRREAATGRLADARSKLSDVINARKDFAASVKAGVMGNAGSSSIFGESMQAQRDARQAALDFNSGLQPTVMGAGTVTLNGSSYTPSWTTSVAGKAQSVPKVSAHAGLLAVKASLKKLLADTKTFAANLKVLMYRGIDPYTYDELVQAGVRGGGLETSAALLSDPALSRQLFSLERQVAKAGGRLGTQTAGHEYAGQVASARSAVSRAEASVQRINVTMVVEAKKIDEVDKLIRMVNHVKATARKRKGKH
jgi:tape measure domain-containing protein